MPSFQRTPSREKMISDIGPADSRVSIVGTVIDFRENMMAIDDGTGKINASFEAMPAVRHGQAVRVFGKVIPLDAGAEIQGEVCLDFSGADAALWRQVSRMWEESLSKP